MQGGAAEAGPALGEIASNARDALQEALHEEELAILRKAIDELPPQLRRVCILRYIHQKKYREIAEILRISIETVKAHLYTAKKRIPETLGRFGLRRRK